MLQQERNFVLPPTAPETLVVHDVALELLRALEEDDDGDLQAAAAKERVRLLDWQVRPSRVRCLFVEVLLPSFTARPTEGVEKLTTADLIRLYHSIINNTTRFA